MENNKENVGFGRELVIRYKNIQLTLDILNQAVRVSLNDMPTEWVYEQDSQEWRCITC